MKNNFMLIFCIVVFFILNADNENIKDWTKEKKVEEKGDNKYKEFYLDEEVYRYANNDLSDLRIINKNNDFVPFYIETGYENKINEDKKFDTKLISWQVLKSDKIENGIDYSFEFQVLSGSNDINVNRMSIVTDQAEFSVQIEIYGRDEKNDYSLIQQDSIYTLNDLVKNGIELNDIYDYKFYRIIVLNNAKKMKINKLDLYYSATERKFYYFKKNRNIIFYSRRDKKDTIITLDNQYRLNVLSLLLYTEGNFKREYNVARDSGNYGYVKSGTIYNFVNNNIKIENKKIDFYDVPINNEKIYLIIHDLDNPQIKITRIDVEYKVDKIVFEANKSDSYRLIFGNENAVAPIYDIESYKKYIVDEKKNLCFLSKINDKGKETKKKEGSGGDFKIIFNVLIAITSVLLIFFILLKLIRIKKTD